MHCSGYGLISSEEQDLIEIKFATLSPESLLAILCPIPRTDISSKATDFANLYAKNGSDSNTSD